VIIEAVVIQWFDYSDQEIHFTGGVLYPDRIAQLKTWQNNPNRKMQPV
jgi:hypothetical protein